MGRIEVISEYLDVAVIGAGLALQRNTLHNMVNSPHISPESRERYRKELSRVERLYSLFIVADTVTVQTI